MILGVEDGRDYSHVSLSQICKKLRRDHGFLKKRSAKQLSKGDITEQMNQLKAELKSLQNDRIGDKSNVLSKINTIEQVLGMEKRMKTNDFEQTLAQLDMKPMNAEAFDIQNVLFDYCGINNN